MKHYNDIGYLEQYIGMKVILYFKDNPQGIKTVLINIDSEFLQYFYKSRLHLTPISNLSWEGIAAGISKDEIWRYNNILEAKS